MAGVDADVPGSAVESAGISMLPPAGPGVSLWWCDLDRRAQRAGHCAEWLAPGERERAGRFGNALLRDRYVAGRTALRLVLGFALAVTPAAVPLRRGPRGRPELDGNALLDFNVSHTHGAALIAIAPAAHHSLRIGVDLERLDRVVGADRLARKFLTANERHSQATVPAAERLGRFLRYWTCKEAMSKATGDGLIAPFGKLDVQLGDPPRLIEGPPPYAPAAWRLYAVKVPAGFLGTLAVWMSAAA